MSLLNYGMTSSGDFACFQFARDGFDYSFQNAKSVINKEWSFCH